MKIEEARILYYRTCLSLKGVPDAWDADGANAWFMFEALPHKDFVSFEMWCNRCALTVERPEDTAAKAGQVAVVTLGGNQAPKPPGGKKVQPVVDDEKESARAACAVELIKEVAREQQ